MKKKVLRLIKIALKQLNGDQMPDHVEVDGNQIILLYHHESTTEIITITVSKTEV